MSNIKHLGAHTGEVPHHITAALLDSSSLLLSCGTPCHSIRPQNTTDFGLRHRGETSRHGVCNYPRRSYLLPLNDLFFRVKAHEILRDAGVPCSLILDTAVGYVIDKIDLVLVGSEAVVESGGLINAVGTRQIAMIARLADKPLYALAERYVGVPTSVS